MELKFSKRRFVECVRLGSNRTFMELKSAARPYSIAPRAF